VRNKEGKVKYSSIYLLTIGRRFRKKGIQENEEKVKSNSQ